MSKRHRTEALKSGDDAHVKLARFIYLKTNLNIMERASLSRAGEAPQHSA
jgi:hypothetical protein